MEGRAVVKNVMNKMKGALLTDIIGSSRTKKGESERSEPTMTTEKRALKKAKLRIFRTGYTGIARMKKNFAIS